MRQFTRLVARAASGVYRAPQSFRMTTSATWRSLAQSLIGEPELTAAEVATQAGVDLEQARHLWRALGFPPVSDENRVFTRSDLAVLLGIRRLLAEQATAPDVLIQLTRVIGQSLARVAEAQIAATADHLDASQLVDPAVVDATAERIRSLVPTLEPFLGYVWRRHLLAALLRFVGGADSPSSAGRTLVVGFADLVGFTAISQQLSERELAAMVDRFEARAYEHIPERGGRVVKMIGDEVMFAVDDVGAAAQIALGLVEAYAGDAALPEVRVGLAWGPALSWEGDLFGPVVNLASRLVNIARPGSVLVAEDLGRQLQADAAFTLIHLRPLEIKGIGRVRFWVLRRLASGSPEISPPPRRRLRR